MQEGLYSLMQDGEDLGRARLVAPGQGAVHLGSGRPVYRRRIGFVRHARDIIVSEPGALIGFAGRRTIEGTIGERLPEGFQTAEFSLRHGLLDMVVPRRDLRETLGRILSLLWSQPS